MLTHVEARLYEVLDDQGSCKERQPAGGDARGNSARAHSKKHDR